MYLVMIIGKYFFWHFIWYYSKKTNTYQLLKKNPDGMENTQTLYFLLIDSISIEILVL